MEENRKNTDLREHLNFMPVFCLFKASLFLTVFLLSEKEKILDYLYCHFDMLQFAALCHNCKVI